MKYLQLCQYRKSLPFFFKAESLDYPASFLKLHTIYHYGYGVPKDAMRSKRYAEKAKKQNQWFVTESVIGTADAQYNMGDCYYEGIGVNQDFTEAVRWFSLSASQGSGRARHALVLLWRRRGCRKRREGV